MQRDLSDSTVLRAVGTAFGHGLLAALSARAVGEVESGAGG